MRPSVGSAQATVFVWNLTEPDDVVLDTIYAALQLERRWRRHPDLSPSPQGEG